jgi:hypothetical protein
MQENKQHRWKVTYTQIRYEYNLRHNTEFFTRGFGNEACIFVSPGKRFTRITTLL